VAGVGSLNVVTASAIACHALTTPPPRQSRPPLPASTASLVPGDVDESLSHT